MKKALWIAASILGSAVLLSGCAPSRLEMDYGTSHKLAKFNQTLNPAAEQNLEPVIGMDAQANEKVIEKYRKDFEKPAPAQNLTINLGTSVK